jgi:hypothetical protein
VYILYARFPEGDKVFEVEYYEKWYYIASIWLGIICAGVYPLIAISATREYFRQQRFIADGKSLDAVSDAPAPQGKTSSSFIALCLIVFIATGILFGFETFCRNMSFRISCYGMVWRLPLPGKWRQASYDRWREESTARLEWLEKQTETNPMLIPYHVIATQQYANGVIARASECMRGCEEESALLMNGNPGGKE